MIKFSIYQTPNPRNGEQELKHARFIARGTKKLDEICEDLSDSSTFTSADIKGVLEALTVYMRRQLGYGYSIELEGIGLFSPALRTKIVTEQEKEHYAVSVDGVNFRCSERLKKSVKQKRLQRIKRENEPTGTLETRKKTLLTYLTSNENINESTYSRINHCTRYRASIELKQFLEEGLLQKTGRNTHRVYSLTK